MSGYFLFRNESYRREAEREDVRRAQQIEIATSLYLCMKRWSDDIFGTKSVGDRKEPTSAWTEFQLEDEPEGVPLRVLRWELTVQRTRVPAGRGCRGVG